MRRREFIAGLGGAAAWPAVARAQQPDRVRRIVVLMGIANDADAQARVAALHQGLQEIGRTIGRNIQIEYRFANVMLSRYVPTRKKQLRQRRTSSLRRATRC